MKINIDIVTRSLKEEMRTWAIQTNMNINLDPLPKIPSDASTNENSS